MGTDVSTNNLTENQKVFLDYVERMPATTGQRFIKYLIEQEGFNAFDDFMLKLEKLRTQEDPHLSLSQTEKKALAHAEKFINRRSFLKIAGGIGMIGTSGILAKSTVSDLRDEKPFDAVKVSKVGVKAYAAVISGLFGAANLAQQRYGTESYQVATIAEGKMGKLRVSRLIQAMDELLQPIAISLEETGAQRSR